MTEQDVDDFLNWLTFGGQKQMTFEIRPPTMHEMFYRENEIATPERMASWAAVWMEDVRRIPSPDRIGMFSFINSAFNKVAAQKVWPRLR
jgi:hypothetical protein